jgi:UDP-N-acetylmuramate--alanine ligase
MKYKIMYFIGIKGVGMASLELIAKQAGMHVLGSDVDTVFITDTVLQKEHIQVLHGFDTKNIENLVYQSPDEILVIVTGAHHGLENPEAAAAREKGIKVVTHGQAVGLFMEGDTFAKRYTGISVAGAHGKTTTTALLATCLSFLNQDPTYTVGTSEIFPLIDAGHFGNGPYFVAEADEYASDITHDKKAKLLYQYPDFAIINNIDFDHPDFYQNLDDVKQVFEIFSQQVKKTVIVNGDDTNSQELIKKYNAKCITFGKEEKNIYRITDISAHKLSISFRVFHQQEDKGIFFLSVPGSHNALNALGVIALLVELGFSFDKIREVLPMFKGTKRRSEVLETTSGGAMVIDDYAHHPQEIKTTLESLSQAFPDKKIVCIFQPHMYSRTKALLDDFVSAFEKTNTLFFLPIFASAREKVEDPLIYKEIEQKFNSIKTHVIFPENEAFVVEYINKNLNNPDILIVTMGAGDVYKIGEKLL